MLLLLFSCLSILSLICFNKKQIIDETLEGGTEKTTSYYSDGSFEVKLENEEETRTVLYNKNGNIINYNKEAYDEGGEESSYKSLWFNNQGMLENVCQYS